MAGGERTAESGETESRERLRRRFADQLRERVGERIAVDTDGSVVREGLTADLAPTELLAALEAAAEEQHETIFEALSAGEITAEEAESRVQTTNAVRTEELQQLLGSDFAGGDEDVGADGPAETEESARLGAEGQLPMATQLVDALPMPAFVLSPDHSLIAYNYGTQQLLGIDPTEALGEDYRDTISYAVYADGRREMSLADKVVEAPRSADVAYDVDRVDENMLYTEKYVYEDRATMVNARGEELPIAFLATPIFEDGELVAVLEFFEERESELEEFPGLAGVLSHDVRNPLSVLKTYTKLAEGQLDDRYHDPMLRNIERIEQIIDGVLALTRESEDELDLKSVDVAELTRKAWNHVDTAEATLETDSATVDADRDQLQQALENLLRNNIQHGGEDVTVRVGATEDGFYIADDGPGIPEDERDKVFEHGYSSRTDGTGFGLPIVHKIVTNHGWFIEVTESETGGARFDVRTEP